MHSCGIVTYLLGEFNKTLVFTLSSRDALQFRLSAICFEGSSSWTQGILTQTWVTGERTTQEYWRNPKAYSFNYICCISLFWEILLATPPLQALQNKTHNTNKHKKNTKKTDKHANVNWSYWDFNFLLQWSPYYLQAFIQLIPRPFLWADLIPAFYPCYQYWNTRGLYFPYMRCNVMWMSDLHAFSSV